MKCQTALAKRLPRNPIIRASSISDPFRGVRFRERKKPRRDRRQGHEKTPPQRGYPTTSVAWRRMLRDRDSHEVWRRLSNIDPVVKDKKHCITAHYRNSGCGRLPRHGQRSQAADWTSRASMAISALEALLATALPFLFIRYGAKIIDDLEAVARVACRRFLTKSQLHDLLRERLQLVAPLFVHPV